MSEVSEPNWAARANDLAVAERAVGKVVLAFAQLEILVTMAVQSFLAESDNDFVDAVLDSDRLDSNLVALKRLAKTHRLAEVAPELPERIVDAVRRAKKLAEQRNAVVHSSITLTDSGLGTMSYRAWVKPFDLQTTETLATSARELASEISAISGDVHAAVSGVPDAPGQKLRRVGRLPVRRSPRPTAGI